MDMLTGLPIPSSNNTAQKISVLLFGFRQHFRQTTAVLVATIGILYLFFHILMMSALIQGCKIQSNVSSIDFNSSCTHFATGGRDSIKIFELRLQDKCWFDCKKTIGKYKGTSITKTCVSQLAWNKHGNEHIAIGTTSGYVLVYEANNAYKNILQVKGHDGNINNIEWNTGSKDCFVSSSFENYILQWDTRQTEAVAKYEYSDTTKIRDLKFSPHNEHLLAVQSSTKLEISDYRMGNKAVCCYEIHDNELQGIGVQWDPNCAHRIASAISKEISIFDIVPEGFHLSNSLAHYSLIKSFYWMRTKENHFGVLGEHPEKNIFFYDLEDKNRISYMYGGHGRSIDCWKMDHDESILLSASNIKEKSSRNTGGGSWGVLVGQYTDNYYDPNEPKYNYPLTFDNNHALAFCLTHDEHPKKTISASSSFHRKKSNKLKQTSPLVYAFIDGLDWSERETKLPSVKEEFLYLYKNYIVEGKNEEIALNNSQVAKRVGKLMAASVWKHLFQFAFPPETEDHTIDSLYQQKLEVDTEIIENRVTLFNRQQLTKQPKKVNLLDILQELVDQNQLQSAVIAAICLMNKAPALIPEDFMHRIFTPYIQLLHNLELYEVATDTIMLTRNKAFTDITQRNTTYNIACGWCKESISKGNCKCNKLCVICQGSLSERMVIWCKYCGHGGHALQYEKWFKEDKKQLCPHGCGHACYTPDDF